MKTTKKSLTQELALLQEENLSNVNAQDLAEARFALYALDLDEKELAELVQRAQGHDEAAAKILYAKFEPVFTYLCHPEHIKNVLGHEDALQSCYLYFWQLLCKYKG